MGEHIDIILKVKYAFHDKIKSSEVPVNRAMTLCSK